MKLTAIISLVFGTVIAKYSNDTGCSVPVGECNAEPIVMKLSAIISLVFGTVIAKYSNDTGFSFQV